MAWLALYNGDPGTGVEYAIGAASSADGKTWERYEGNPVLEAGTGWEASHVKDPCVIWDGEQFILYYAGNSDGTASGYRIGRATAPDIVGPWTRYASNPVLSVGAGGAFDDAAVMFPVVLYEPDDPDPDRRWKMWYGAYDGTINSIGYAYSGNGLTWTKVGQVLAAGAGGTWNDEGMLPGAVVNDGGTYHLFVGGRQGTTNPRWQGGLWTFTDPEGTYTPDAGNPNMQARFGVSGVSQVLTANALSGQRTIAVASTAAWSIGEVIVLADTNSPTETHRIESLTSTTALLERNLASSMTVAEGATARPITYNSVFARSVVANPDGGWWFYGTAFQPVEDLSLSGPNKLREASLRWEAVNLDDQPEVAFDSGLMFPLYPYVSGTWDDISAENPSVVNTDPEAGGGGGGGGGGPWEPPEPARAILEIYVHDEDASRWGVATWATGPATGTEGIWSAAGWQDVTPEGVNAHIIWGSRRPSRGILADQNAASWNVETYDPDRILDPGNFDSPYYPQLVAGVPIRVSHDSLVIRTGYVDEWHYKHKRPYYQGQILATDTWAMLNQAMVPADSVLSNTLYGRIQDAIEAAGIAVGGIPLPPSGTGPTIADWIEGAPLDDPTSVGDHVRIATAETLWIPFIQADAGLGLRAWGTPLDRGREISAPNLEDLESISSEDGLYSVVRVQVEDPDLDPIEREAAPLPRYGRRLWERREPTVDPEGYAAAILAERPWPGVQYVPGAIHCFTAADVDYFGSLEIMERVTITLPGAVSVQGRILGGELFVEQRAGSTHGAKWIFNFAVATDGSTAIGLTTLVADGTGYTLLDDATETDYLEAD